MGLDSYLGRLIINEDGHKELSIKGLKFPKTHLCGGMCSGDGSDGSFRGKVYAGFIDYISDENLYEDNINLEKIAGALEGYIADHKDDRPKKDTLMCYGNTWGEVKDLAKLFRYAADQKLDYHAWY
jgi:hypothetical protein